MIMACVLYDQIDGEGVFVRSSKIPVRWLIVSLMSRKKNFHRSAL
jgi:hypothetical protein